MHILVFMGAVLLFIGIKVLVAKRTLKNQPSTIVSSKVVGYEKRKSRSRSGSRYTYAGYSYAPIFEYYYEGKTRQVSHSFATNNDNWLKDNFPVGKTVELLVYENDADNAVLNTGSGLNIEF